MQDYCMSTPLSQVRLEIWHDSVCHSKRGIIRATDERDLRAEWTTQTSIGLSHVYLKM